MSDAESPVKFWSKKGFVVEVRYGPGNISVGKITSLASRDLTQADHLWIIVSYEHYQDGTVQVLIPWSEVHSITMRERLPDQAARDRRPEDQPHK